MRVAIRIPRKLMAKLRRHAQCPQRVESGLKHLPNRTCNRLRRVACR
jgi:hypothetical protein